MNLERSWCVGGALPMEATAHMVIDAPRCHTLEGEQGHMQSATWQIRQSQITFVIPI